MGMRFSTMKSINYKIIPLTKGMEAIVDTEDYEWLTQWKWHTFIAKYAARSQWIKGKNKKKTILMHRLIMNTPDDMDTDHINGNGLDNRKCNLRVCTSSQNHMNQNLQKKDKTSKYKGVYWNKERDKWQAYITVGKVRSLGRFDKEDDAAMAYNMAGLRNFREFAKLNYIPAMNYVQVAG